MNESRSAAEPYDLIGVGFGPSNLALAIAAEELDPDRSCLFLERNEQVRWHPGMLIDGARMQISYLKDLVSLRNLASPYTFLSYLKANGRLERFINLDQSHPTRLEYQDYLTWVARHFQDVVRYGSEVVAITPACSTESSVFDLLKVCVRDVHTGETREYLARNVVYATGGKPRWGNGETCCSAAVVHSSRFLPDFPGQFQDRAAAHEFGVVGDGQSAAEIAGYLLNHYPAARVHLFVRGYALRSTDNNSFVNELYYGAGSEDFYASDPRQRAALLAELRSTNYGVVEGGFLEDLYRQVYADEVRGTPRLVVHRGSDVTQIAEDGSRLTLRVRDRFGAPNRTVTCDGVVLATGYTRSLDTEVMGELLPMLERDESGDLAVSSDYRVRTASQFTAGLYLQGFAETSFGLGDTLLSLLPFRSQQIFTDICKDVAQKRSVATPRVIAYPPRQFIETDLEKIYAVMAQCNFATLISADENGEALVTHVPLVLDRTRGERGTLLGHMDRANPQVRQLEAGRATVVFHGPNSYLSPNRLRTDQLPTWNSMSVHVRGRARLFSGRDELMGIFDGLCENADPSPGGYRMRPDDIRVDRLIDYVIGFEIEIDELVGRFKLAQNLDDVDRTIAATEMLHSIKRGDRALIERVFGLRLANGHPVNPAINGKVAR